MNETTRAYWQRVMDWHRQAKETQATKVQWNWLPFGQTAKFIAFTSAPKAKGQALPPTSVQAGESLQRWDDDGGAANNETVPSPRTIGY